MYRQIEANVDLLMQSVDRRLATLSALERVVAEETSDQSWRELVQRLKVAGVIEVEHLTLVRQEIDLSKQMETLPLAKQVQFFNKQVPPLIRQEADLEKRMQTAAKAAQDIKTAF